MKNLFFSPPYWGGRVGLTIILICLPLAGFGQTSKKIIVDTIVARTDSNYMKSPISLKYPIKKITRQIGDSTYILRLLIASLGGTLTSGFLKASGSTLVPYANGTEAPHGYPYWDHDYIYDYLRFDTAIYIQSKSNIAVTSVSYSPGTAALYGYSLGQYADAVFGLSTYGCGGVFESIGRTGLVVGSDYGFTLARFGITTSDSVVIRKNGTIHQYNGSAEKFSTSTDGMIKLGNDTVPVRKPIAADTTSLSGRVGDTFIDTAKKYWYNTHNGRGGWVKLNYILPFAILFRRKKLKSKIS